ncbi:Co2+/Mg2+ efflux protein ApaG [Mangrovimicrobium sediminis]|uniref:Protein ApaG n=1 Tax=Mangrovimicrobium sediminis TaxID=2562682 RepID=A0A4Z0LYX1_9GAMM|nr:Co2+/Mg2+ efflux protein ApaG [Haliea sp. SAOS-164]TGD72489.1 Co2+/Mg2+ efflux protein ApaG [Haliea sp. SAOS-164]
MAEFEFNPSLVNVEVATAYLPGHSDPEEDQYTFAYTITISNAGDRPVQLLSRHWVITDADNLVQEVRGEGVVGEQPVIEPGDYFRYTSGTTLNTPVGFMEGSYFMVAWDEDDDPEDAPEKFQVPIPAFTLHTPTALN